MKYFLLIILLISTILISGCNRTGGTVDFEVSTNYTLLKCEKLCRQEYPLSLIINPSLPECINNQCVCMCG
jgi:hypothetical protein